MTATRPARPRSPWATDEHELFRETARAWVEREILPQAMQGRAATIAAAMSGAA